MVKRFILKLKNKKVLEELDKIEISDKAIEQFRFSVKWNRHKDVSILKKKLKRNFILAKDFDYRTKVYGNLYIYHENNLITSIYNLKGGENNISINQKLKNELDYILGI